MSRRLLLALLTVLAAYKVPRDVVFMDELPRNATGKVLKRELSDDDGNAAD